MAGEHVNKVELTVLNKLESEANRFLDKLAAYRREVKDLKQWTPWHSRKRAAMKRASLDLSNILADYRQGRL